MDLRLLCDKNSSLPHTLPSIDVFIDHMKSIGVQVTDQIVLYDSHPQVMMAVGRCAWLLRYFGAENVRILNGGIKKWQLESRNVVFNQPL